MSQTVDIILPVYRGLALTERTICSVFASSNETDWHLIIINDASPEPEMTALLEKLCADKKHVTLLSNDENLGFVQTVNRGMALHDDRNAVLLNSDTIVQGNWLDRLVAHADETTASITPFSNNATICSTPRIGDDLPLPAGLREAVEATQALDRAHASANKGESVTIPTGVGFCMWLNRRALQEIGDFDAEAFGRGYGEETDWCMRAIAAGYVHKLACDVFVYHEGGGSFGDESAALKSNAEKIMEQRHPGYLPSVRKWIKADSAAPYRLAAVAALYKQSDMRVILHINHHLGGGTDKHLRELCEAFQDNAHDLILSPAVAGAVILKSARAEDGIDLIFDLYSRFIDLQDALTGMGLSRIHLHHVLGFNEPLLRQLVQHLGVPFDVTIHDYHLLNPLTYLCHPNGQPCYALDVQDCPDCSETDAQRLVEWQGHYSWWLTHASRVIAPSYDVAQRVTRTHPDAPVIQMPHIDSLIAAQSPRLAELSENMPLRIVILGALAWHKGAARLRALAKEAAEQGMALEIHHFGNIVEEKPPKQQGNVRFIAHGVYEETSLFEQLSSISPHLIWFPGTCMETYSYTLSQAMAFGAPIWAPALGPFPERLSGYIWHFTFAAEETSGALLKQLTIIKGALTSQIPPEQEAQSRVASGHCYAEDYLAWPAAAVQTESEDKRLRVGWITHTPEQPDACAYIRLVQPLTHEAMASEAELVPLRLHEVWDAKLDALVLARTTVCAPQMIDKLCAHAAKQNIPIIYDLDDDILNLPPEHPEYEHYQRLKPGVEQWLRRASRVMVSTPMLESEVAKYRPAGAQAPLIMPNYLDEALWPGIEPAAFESLHGQLPLRVLYMGTPTHQPDFAVIEKAIRPVLKRHNAILTLIGVHKPQSAPAWCEVLQPPASAITSYPRFAKWLQLQQKEKRWQIGLAPLRDLPFNHSKSGLKYMEYSALGLAGIYADLPPYRDVVSDQKNGRLINAESPEAWASALDSLLSNSGQRIQLARHAYDDIAAQHVLAADATLWAPVWLNALCSAPNLKCPTQTFAACSAFTSLLVPLRKRNIAKRLLHIAYHRYASHSLIRFIWNRMPCASQQFAKHFIRRLSAS